jgi:predicted dehydrogenase
MDTGKAGGTDTKLVRLAMVGIGGYGFDLYKAIHDVSQQARCQLVAAADNRMKDFPDNVKRLQADGVQMFDDALVMFEQLKGKCDAVYIATGIASHTFLTTAALQAGYHVHLEKPPAATVQEVDRMIQVAQQTGKMCMVGFNLMHSDDVLAIKQRIVSGRLGKVRSLSCHAATYRMADYYARNDWAGNVRSGNNWVLDGPATNALAHQTNNILFLASDQPGQLARPIVVQGELYSAWPIEGHDTVCVRMQLEGGCEGFFCTSHCGEKNWEPTLTIDCTQGLVQWEMRRGATITYHDGTSETISISKRYDHHMVETFVQAIRSSDAGKLLCPLPVTRNFVLAIDGLHESSGKIHRIDPKFCRRVDDGTPGAHIIINGLDDLLVQAAHRRKLFSELGAPWAVKTETFDLDGYTNFPKRFVAQPG